MNILIPKEYVQELQQVINIFKEIAVSNHLMENEDIEIPKLKQFGPGEIPATIYIAGGITIWFTKKWADTYLWPEIEKRIDNPSKKVVEWLIQTIENNNKED